VWYLRKLPGGMGWSGSSKSFLFRYVSLELGGTTIGRTPQLHAKKSNCKTVSVSFVFRREFPLTALFIVNSFFYFILITRELACKKKTLSAMWPTPALFFFYHYAVLFFICSLLFIPFLDVDYSSLETTCYWYYASFVFMYFSIKLIQNMIFSILQNRQSLFCMSRPSGTIKNAIHVTAYFISSFCWIAFSIHSFIFFPAEGHLLGLIFFALELAPSFLAFSFLAQAVFRILSQRYCEGLACCICTFIIPLSFSNIIHLLKLT